MARPRADFGGGGGPTHALARRVALDQTPLRHTAFVRGGRTLAADEVTITSAWDVTPEGYVQAQARLTRTGIFNYYELPDGTEPSSVTDATAKVVRHLRLPSEVLSPAALASLDRKPITRGHPISKLVDVHNWREHARGIVDQVRADPDGEHVLGRVLIQDAETIADVQAGVRQISCGYYFSREEVPSGQWTDAAGEIGPAGNVYAVDVIQREISGNHHAIVMRGRAGPTASILLDEAPPETTTMNPDEIKAMIAEALKGALTPEALKAMITPDMIKDAVKEAMGAAGASDKPADEPATDEPPAAVVPVKDPEKEALKVAVDSLMAEQRARVVGDLVRRHGAEIATDAAGIAKLGSMSVAKIKREVLAKRGVALPAGIANDAVDLAYATAMTISGNVANDAEPTDASLMAGLIAVRGNGLAAVANDYDAAIEKYEKGVTTSWQTPLK